jgi:hypothetical protein
MLKILKNMSSDDASSILANTALSIMPSAEEKIDGREDLILRENVLNEIKRLLEIDLNDNSDISLGKIYDYIYSEIIELSLNKQKINKIKERVGQKGLLKLDQYDIKFEKQFSSLSQLGIRKSHVQSAIRNPDLVEHLYDKNYEDFSKISLFLKFPKPDFCLLVYASRSGSTLIVLWAWRIYTSDIDISKASTALDILKLFVEKYGIELKIGKKSSKFFISEKISFSSIEDAKKYLNPEYFFDKHGASGKSIIGSFMVKLNEKEPSIVIDNVYCIDLDKYRKILNKKTFC